MCRKIQYSGMSAAEAYGAMPGTGAGAGTGTGAEPTERDGFFRPVTRAEAEVQLSRYPTEPILRTCSYTPTFPSIFAVSYVIPGGELRHTLVRRLSEQYWCAIREETDPTGIVMIEPTGEVWCSTEEMRAYFVEQSTRFPTHVTTRRLAAARAPLVRASSGAHDSVSTDTDLSVSVDASASAPTQDESHSEAC